MSAGTESSGRYSAAHSHTRETPEDVRTRRRRAVAPLTDAFGFRTHVHPKLADPRAQSSVAMLRQRVRVRTSSVALIGRAILILFSLALIWYGLMLILLALKVSPHTVNQISGYRTAYDYLSGRTAATSRPPSA